MKDVKVSIKEKMGKCGQTVLGEYFVIKGGKLYFPPGQGICLYALSALMPMLAPWQMDKKNNDHFILDYTEFVCPMGNVKYQARQYENIDIMSLKSEGTQVNDHSLSDITK